MKVSVLKDKGLLVYEDREIPEISNDEVLIKIKKCGICGTDLHFYESGRISDIIIETPLILGHECSGEIVKIGENVSNFIVGDLVAVEPGIPCGKCEYCKNGRYNLCKEVAFLGEPPTNGAFAEYIKYPAHMVYKLPYALDLIEGALIEPFCVGLHGIQVSNARAGQSAIILGSGCIGLCTLLALKANGINDIYVIDIIDIRLEKARELGATAILNGKDVDIIEEIKNLTNGNGVDLVFETAGVAFTTKQTADLVKIGGSIILMGMSANANFEYNFGKILFKEAKIHTVFRYRNLYPIAINMVKNGVPLKKIATNFFNFNEIPRAFREVSENKASIVKGIVEFD